MGHFAIENGHCAYVAVIERVIDKYGIEKVFYNIAVIK